MSELKIGDIVVIAKNDSVLDCCQGKRGVITHKAVGGGWLLNTDHFCPVARRDEELTLVPIEQLAREVFEGVEQSIVDGYMTADKALLLEYAGRDKKAWAALVLRDGISDEV